MNTPEYACAGGILSASASASSDCFFQSECIVSDSGDSAV